MIIRPAIPSDCPALLQLHLQSVGKNLWHVEKCPDYAKLLQQPNKHIILVVTLADGRIMASLSAIEYVCMFRGKKLPAYYLGDVKVDVNFRESPLLITLIKRVMSNLKKNGVELLFYENTAIPGISAPFPLIGLDDIISFHGIQSMLNYLLLPKQLPFKVTTPLTVTGYDEQPLKNFYDHCHSSRSFYPVVDQLYLATHFTCTQNQIIKAALTVSDCDDQGHYVSMRVAADSSRSLLGTIRGLVRLPPASQTGFNSRILIIKYFGYETGHESTLISLLEHAMHFAWENRYQYLSLAVHQEDILLNQLIRPIAKWLSRSTVMVSAPKDHPISFDGSISISQIKEPTFKRRP